MIYEPAEYNIPILDTKQDDEGEGDKSKHEEGEPNPEGEEDRYEGNHPKGIAKIVEGKTKATNLVWNKNPLGRIVQELNEYQDRHGQERER